MNGKIHMVFHMQKIQADIVQRKLVFLMFAGNFPDMIRGGITPAALPVSESPAGRDVGPADGRQELMKNIHHIFAADLVQNDIFRTGDDELIRLRVSDIKNDSGGSVGKDSQGSRTVNYQKIVGTVNRNRVRILPGIVAVVAYVGLSATVQMADVLTQTVNPVTRFQLLHKIPQLVFAECTDGGRERGALHRNHDGFCVDGSAVNGLNNHRSSSFQDFIIKQDAVDDPEQDNSRRDQKLGKLDATCWSS